jgi:hypothetical protein
MKGLICPQISWRGFEYIVHGTSYNHSKTTAKISSTYFYFLILPQGHILLCKMYFLPVSVMVFDITEHSRVKPPELLHCAHIS